jgi:hypothetical protein
MNESFTRFAGWTAYANAALSIGILITLVAMFAIDDSWGTVNDAISVFWALSFLSLMVMLYRLNAPDNASLSLAAPNLAIAIVGIAAMVAFAVLQSLLVLDLVSFEQTFSAVVTLGTVFGITVALNGLLARGSQTLPSGLTKVMIAFGVSYVLSAVGFLLGGWQNPLAGTGYLIGAITGPIWAIWLGRLLLDGRVLAPALASIGGS